MANIPPVPPLTKAGFEDPVWVKWLDKLRSGVTTAVTNLTIATSNGFAGVVAPGVGGSVITLSTTVVGILKGGGGAISAAVPGTDYVGALTVTAPLVRSGTTTVNIVIPQATSTVDGYLLHSDWATFNAKQGALGYTPLNPANNLSDLANAVTARANLSLGSMALQSSAGVSITGGAIAGVVVSGTFSGAATWSGTQTYGSGIVVTAGVTTLQGMTATSMTISPGSGSINPSTTGGIVGTTLGDNANAGSVGEYVESQILAGAAVSLVSGTVKDVTTITLSAGDWDVWGNVTLNPAGTTTISVFQGGVSLVANTQGTYPNHGSAFLFYGAGATAFPFSSPTGVLRVNVTASQVVHLVVSTTFAVSTCAAYGALCARRVR